METEDHKIFPETELEVEGITFALRIHDDPSGLRGQVFYGEEKIAGVQVFHQKSVEKLKAVAIKDRAVRRAVDRLKGA